MGRGPIIAGIVERMHHWRYVILEYEGNPRFTDNAGKISSILIILTENTTLY